MDRRSFLAWASTLPAAPALLSASRSAATQPAAQPAERQEFRSRADRGLADPTDFLLTDGLAYLQTGSVGPSPKPVLEKSIAAWRELEQNPTIGGYRLGQPKLEDVRAKTAALLHCRQDEVVLTRGATDGMNAVACAMNLSAGDRVLTTDQEHGGGSHCWEYYARHRGVVVDRVTIPPGENDAASIIDRFRSAFRTQTRALSFSHVLYTTGLRMPVAELCALARERGLLTIVDGAQAPGGMAVDVQALACDVYVATGHKWLLGPKGQGFMFLREEVRDRVPLIAEQHSRQAQSDSTGLLNLPGIVGLGAAIDYITTFGIQRVEAYNVSLRNQLFEMLATVPNIRIVSPTPGVLASPMLTVRLPESVVLDKIHKALLDKHRVMTRGVPALPNGLRFSMHLFNTLQDLQQAVEALQVETA